MDGGIDFTDLLKMLAALVLVLGLMGGLGLLLRYMPGQASSLSGKTQKRRRLQILESLPLDPRRRAVLLRCDETRDYLLVLGPNGETLVDRIDPPSAFPDNEDKIDT